MGLDLWVTVLMHDFMLSLVLMHEGFINTCNCYWILTQFRKMEDKGHA